ncbi:MAG: YIP1 family protein [Bacteroidales bacterium]|nr:YIP1 family protein [Bacteroidales bacterium]
MKNILYKFGKILSEGKGRQLLWLSALILVVLTILFLLLRNSLGRNGVLALFFGLSSLADVKDGVLIRLFVYLLGTLLFSTFLISVISNIFDNFSSSFKEGRLEVDPQRHTLLLGAGHMLTGMLREMSKRELKRPIVILTTGNIEELRERLFSTFSSKAYKQLRNKLVLIYGERDNEDALKSVNAGCAEEIYILGEDHEDNHDGKSLSSVKLLKKLRAEGLRVRCKVFLEDPYSVHSQIVKNENMPDENGNSSGMELFCLDLINVYDDMAEKVLKEHVPAIGLDSPRHLHLVVTGYGRMSWSFVKTAFSMLHFPNFDEGSLKNRTTITVIDEKAGQFLNEYMSLYANIFQLSNVRYEFKENGMGKVRHFYPSEGYGDFLDTEWEFIEGDIRDMDIRTRLEEWAEDDTQQLCISLCDREEASNIGAALSLPRSLYEKDTIPVFAYLPSGSAVLNTFGAGVFGGDGCVGRIISFGKDPDSDVLFEGRSDMAKRTHYVYKAFEKEKDGSIKEQQIRSIEDEWYALPERFKLSNYYYAAAIPVKVRSLGFNPAEPVDRQLSEEACEGLDRVEHRRWVAADLLLGYYPPSAALAAEDPGSLKRRFIHPDIAPAKDLSKSERNKDSNLRLISYIVSGNTDLLIHQLDDDAGNAEADGEQQNADRLRQNMRRIRSLSSSLSTHTAQ